MKRLIALLRRVKPSSVRYDEIYMELMRDVLHQMADEKRQHSLKPIVFRLLQDHLSELGGRMTKRELQHMAPRAANVAVNGARALPFPLIALLASAIVAGLLLGRWMTCG